MKTGNLLKAALVAGTISTSTQAALVVNDNFEYGASDIASNSVSFTSTTGWSGGSSNMRYESGASDSATWTLGDSDYVLIPSGKSSGGSMAGASAAAAPSARGMQLDLGTTLSGTFWLSAFLRNNETAADGVAMLGFENGTMQISSVDFDGFGIRNGGNLATTTGTGSFTDRGALVGSTTGYKLFVAKLTVNGSGANDSLSLWVFDTSSSFGQTEASLGTATFTSSTMQFGDAIGDVWFGSTRATGGTAASAYLDNLRISDLSTNDGLKEVLTGVPIPEPTSLAALTLASMVVMRRRR